MKSGPLSRTGMYSPFRLIARITGWVVVQDGNVGRIVVECRHAEVCPSHRRTRRRHGYAVDVTGSLYQGVEVVKLSSPGLRASACRTPLVVGIEIAMCPEIVRMTFRLLGRVAPDTVLSSHPATAPARPARLRRVNVFCIPTSPYRTQAVPPELRQPEAASPGTLRSFRAPRSRIRSPNGPPGIWRSFRCARAPRRTPPTRARSYRRSPSCQHARTRNGRRPRIRRPE